MKAQDMKEEKQMLKGPRVFLMVSRMRVEKAVLRRNTYLGLSPTR